MIAFLLAQAVAVADGTGLGALPRQELPQRGCAAYLWTTGAEHRFVALAGSDPARLRLVIDGQPTDLPLVAGEGTGGLGLAATTRYQLGAIAATLDLSVEARASLSGGGVVPGATLQLDRPGHDGVVVPLGGLVGCAPSVTENR